MERLGDREVVADGAAEQINGGGGIVLLQLDRGTNWGNKKLLHKSVQWRFLSDFLCDPIGVLGFPRAGKRKSQYHFPVSFQLTLKSLVLGLARLDGPARLSVPKGRKNKPGGNIFRIRKQLRCL